MRTGFRFFLFSLCVLGGISQAFAAASPADVPGNDLDTRLFRPANTASEKVGALSCKPVDYQRKPSAVKTCLTCQQTVAEWKRKLPEVAKKAAEKDSMFAGLFGSSSSSAVKGLGSNQSGGFNTGGGVASDAKGKMKNREKNATEAQSEFKKCEEDIKKKCAKDLIPEDQDPAEKMFNACAEADQNAGKFAKEQNKGGEGMGDISKLMDAASKAMQAMQQNKGEEGATSPTPAAAPATVAAAPAIEQSKFDSNKISGASVGFGTAPAAAASSASAPGSGLTGMASSDGHNSSGSSLPPNGEGGGPSATAGTGGGSSGGGGGGGSGASRPGDGSTAAPADSIAAGGFEVNGGGGLRMVGLKPAKGDSSDGVADGGLAPLDAAPPVEELGNREPASETAGDSDALSSDGDSIFLRIKSRYSLLKGAGRI